MKVRILFYFLLLSGGIYFFHTDHWDRLVRSYVSKYESQLIEGSRSLGVFVLKPDDWMVFNFPPGLESVTLITNANLPLKHDAAPDDVWNYSIEYRLINPEGETVRNGEYYCRSQYTEYLDAETNQTHAKAFYIDERIKPLDGQAFRLKLTNLAPPDQQISGIQIRQGILPTPLVDVCLRMNIQKPFSSKRLRYQWRRLSRSAKEQLSQGNVYSYDLLTEDEQLNILKSLTDRLAPAGVQGVDFQLRNMHVLDEIGDPVEENKILPTGLFIHPGQHAMIPLPDQEGQIRLEFIKEEGAVVNSASPEIVLKKYGRSFDEREEMRLSSIISSTTVSSQWPGGLLEIISPCNMVARAYFSGEDNKESEITPDTNYVRTFLIQDATAEYEILSESEGITPIRLDFRIPYALNGEENHSRNAFAICQFLDAEDNVIKHERLAIASEASQYDSIPKVEIFPSVSDSVSYYFSISSKMKKLRITAEQNPFLASCYNRPQNLVQQTMVPEDYIRFNQKEIHRRSWFYLPPSNQQVMMRSQLVIPIAYQTRPPEDKDYLAEGLYEWESFQPVNRWRGRELLAPTQAKDIRRDESLPSIYQEIPNGREVTWTFISPIKERQITPTLMIFSQESKSIPYILEIDGAVIHQSVLTSKRMQVILPPITVGKHKIRINSDGAALFLINHSRPASGKLFEKRLAARLEAQPLEYIFPKIIPDEETLSIRYFSEYGTTKRNLIKITIEGGFRRLNPGPFPSWTMTHRLYDLASTEDSQTYVLNTKDQVVDQGQLFFLPFRADMPPGEYRIRLELLSSNPGYVILSRILPGLEEQRNFFTESRDTIKRQ